MVRRILIIGGTGVFGQRLLTHLASFGNVEIFCSSRSRRKAEDLAARLQAAHPGYQISGIALENQQNLQQVLTDIKPFAIVDCSGPFQNTNYQTAEIILKSGAHLIDLADARDYLAQFHKHLDGVASKHQVTALTGASSTPALSTCLVRDLTQDWQRIDTIDICITPGGKSNVGSSVIAAMMSYAGEKIPIWRNGQLESTIGWANSAVRHMKGLGKRHIAAVETYDAEYLGTLFKVQSRVSFSAGLESPLEQFGMELIARLRKHRLIPHPRHLIPLLLQLKKVTRLFTSDQGAMQVDVSGIDATGQFATAQWSLLAQQGHGPFVPVLPAAAALRRLLAGEIPAGANTADKQLELKDIQTEMSVYEITMSTTKSLMRTDLFQSCLKAEFNRLRPAVQRFHEPTGEPVWRGKASVEVGRNIVSRIVARFLNLPAAGTQIPVTVTVERLAHAGEPMKEDWTRRFGDRQFATHLSSDRPGMLIERFGLLSLHLNLEVISNGLAMSVTGWRLGALPLPSAMAPVSIAREYEDHEGRFNFDIQIRLPFFGRLVHYKGWLLPEIQSAVENK